MIAQRPSPPPPAPSPPHQNESSADRKKTFPAVHYFTKTTVSLTYPANAPGPRIYQAPGYTWARGPNTQGPWIYQRPDHARALNTPMLWRYRGSEYLRALNKQGPKYASTLNIPGLNRLLKLAECLWIIREYAWLCLKMPECWPLSCNFKINLNHYSQNSLFQNFQNIFSSFS